MIKKLFSRETLISGLLICLSSLVGVVVMEVILRYVEHSKNAQPDIRLFLDTASAPCQVRPNLRITAKIGNEDKLIATNSLGMHWREVSMQKPANTKRIAFVGDSFTFGEWASRFEQSFAGVVDAKLNPHGFEVLNFGVPNDGLQEAEMRLQQQILSYEPDYVVMMSYAGNDFIDTYLGVDRTDCVTGRLSKSALAKIPAAFRTPPLEALTIYLDKHYASIRALRHIKGRFLNDNRFMQETDDTISLTTPEATVNFFDATFWMQTAYPPIAVSATDAVLQSLKRIEQLVNGHGAELIIMTLPFRAQVYAAQAIGEHYDISLPQRHIEAFAAQSKMTYYDLLPPLRRYAQKCQAVLYTPSDSHFNDLGHRVTGEFVVRFLARELNLRSMLAEPGVDCLSLRVADKTP